MIAFFELKHEYYNNQMIILKTLKIKKIYWIYEFGYENRIIYIIYKIIKTIYEND